MQKKILKKNSICLKYVEDSKILTLHAKSIVKEVKKDKILQKILFYTVSDWTNSGNEFSVEEHKYFNRNLELYCEEDCLMLGTRVVIPECLKKRVLEELHESYMGILKIKAVSR